MKRIPREGPRLRKAGSQVAEHLNRSSAFVTTFDTRVQHTDGAFAAFLARDKAHTHIHKHACTQIILWQSNQLHYFCNVMSCSIHHTGFQANFLTAMKK